MKSVTINRHNYEEFFLLYVDNELKAQEKTAVENFVGQNPDLARELETLRQTALGDNTIAFTNKESLYKKETGVSLNNYEEYFLLSADNELNKQQVNEVEDFVLKHPQLQNEFTLLNQTRLQPETILFTDKKILYRHQKERRIIPVTFLRISAAAAVIGIIITTAVLNRPDENNNNSTVLTNSNNNRKTRPENNNKPVAQKPVTEKIADKSPVKKESVTSSRNIATASSKHVKSNSPENKKIQNYREEFAVDKTNPQQKTVIKHDTLSIAKSTIDGEKNSVPEKIKTESLEDKINSDIINNFPEDHVYSVAKQNIAKEKPVIVSHAVYLQTDDDEEEKTLYIGSAEINKNKLKGLFKKATAFLDKKIRRNKE